MGQDDVWPGATLDQRTGCQHYSIYRAHLGCDEEVLPDVSFYAQGAFNKLYKVSTVDTTCLMRASLPFDPRYKTESEVATIEFVRQKTSLPVPRIIAFKLNFLHS